MSVFAGSLFLRAERAAGSGEAARPIRAATGQHTLGCRSCHQRNHTPSIHASLSPPPFTSTTRPRTSYSSTSRPPRLPTSLFTMAFVSAVSIAPRSTARPSSLSTSFTGARVAAAPVARAATLTMKKTPLPPVTESLGKKGLAAQGWTRWSETLNGRGAMLGLLIGFATEQLSPTHASIFEQVQTAVAGPAGLLAKFLTG
ncbi:hypothetical protein I4F81_012181 [Pyropia yezoensis]|uniref:Uncharacterized protein n=1 Tax=Pyropia yezoensis TaxID=2788 RepID=A0ACC3CIL1_PYRYE|nr:hypothetical protein I4F81_012181 [Neopyropia yezoensis]